MTENQKLIKKLIDDYNAQIKYYENKYNEWQETIRERNNAINALRTALEQVGNIPEAEQAISSKIEQESRYVENSKKFVENAQADYEAVKKSKRIFLEVIWDNCEHEWEWDSNDYHKNEDYYRCTICGKVT